MSDVTDQQMMATHTLHPGLTLSDLFAIHLFILVIFIAVFQHLLLAYPEALRLNFSDLLPTLYVLTLVLSF